MKTPCIKVCTLTPDGSECTGCKRTPAEIADWVSMSEDQREGIMQRCLENVWGTKCKDCINHAKHEEAERVQRSIDELGRGLF